MPIENLTPHSPVAFSKGAAALESLDQMRGLFEAAVAGLTAYVKQAEELRSDAVAERAALAKQIEAAKIELKDLAAKQAEKADLEKAVADAKKELAAAEKAWEAFRSKVR